MSRLPSQNLHLPCPLEQSDFLGLELITWLSKGMKGDKKFGILSFTVEIVFTFPYE